MQLKAFFQTGTLSLGWVLFASTRLQSSLPVGSVAGATGKIVVAWSADLNQQLSVCEVDRNACQVTRR